MRPNSIPLVALLAPQASYAFTPNTMVQPLHLVGSRTVRHVVPNEKTIAEPGFDLQPQENEQDFSFEAIDFAVEPIIDALIESDPARDILLDSISRASPDSVSEAIESDVARHVDSIISQSDDSPTISLADGSYKVQSSADNLLGDLTSFQSTSIANGTSLNEGVQAVLKASGQAAAAAEASMPAELVQQLDFRNANATADFTPVKIETIPEILSASAVVGEPVTVNKIDPPKVSRILKFAIPAIGVWLCGPLLSLIDTSAVGLFSGTVQQAALNPAVAVTDYAALLIAFMYTGATNLVAAAQESDRGTPDKPVTTKTLIGAMQLSTYVGAGLGAVLFVFARPLLKAIIGNDAISPAVFAAAMKYVRIRALGMPAAAIIGSTQAACLGMQDIRSPLYVLVAAAVVNFFCDVSLVGHSHPLIGGAAGAAWATVLSQYVAVSLFVKWLIHKPAKSAQPRVVNLSKAILEITGKPTSEGGSRREKLRDALETFSLKAIEQKRPGGRLIGRLFKKNKIGAVKRSVPKENGFSVRGFLADRFSFKDLVKLPSAETRTAFSPYLIPVTSTQVGRVSGYVAMSHVVASSMGTVSMAAQQVIVSLFYCLTPVADSLSLTAQAFLPSISEKAPSPERTAALKETALNFIKAGAVFGIAMTGAVSMIPLTSGLFTSDAAVIGLVNSVVPLLLGFFSVHGILCAAEGVLLGQKDLSFLGKMYGVYFLAVPFMMLRVKRAALTGSQVVNLTSVWKVFLGYQMFRCAAWLSRVAVLQRRTLKESGSAERNL